MTPAELKKLMASLLKDHHQVRDAGLFVHFAELYGHHFRLLCTVDSMPENFQKIYQNLAYLPQLAPMKSIA